MSIVPDRSLHHRAPLLWLALPFMAGLAAARGGPHLPVAAVLAVALAVASFALAIERKKPRLGLAGLALAMLLAGDASYCLHRHRLPGWESRPPGAARLSLRIEHIYPQSSPRKASGLAQITAGGGRFRELAGQQVYYSARLRAGQEGPQRSEVVSAAGFLMPVPPSSPPTSFLGSLATKGVNFTLVRCRLGTVEQPASGYYRACDRLARRLHELLGLGLDRRPDLAAMYRAMMLGWKSDLRPEQKQLFMHSGAMHLFAINGVHIGMVAVALHALLALARCPRLGASPMVLAVLWLDVDTTGASPSAVRAFVMAAVLELAWMIRRPCNPIAALAASALLILLADPMDFFSASFQMSYSVVAAILTLGLPLASRIERRLQPGRDRPEITWSRCRRAAVWLGRHLAQAAGIGLAAALVGALTGIEFFGLFSPVGIAANLVLVPLASLAIVSGCLSLALTHGGVQPALFLNRAAGVALAAIDLLMKACSRLPGAWFQAQFRAPWVGPAALSCLVATLLFGYATGWRRDRGGWLPPFAVVAVALVFGVKFV